jgi:hypothetical protein
LEHVDLKSQTATARIIIQNVFKRRVRKQTAIPVVLAVYFNGRESRRQRTTGHDVFGADCHMRTVKIGKLAGANIHRADAQTNIVGFVDAVEVDQSVQRALESGRVVIADAFFRREPIVQLPRREKSGLTDRQGQQYADPPLRAGQQPIEFGRPQTSVAGYFVPEGA